MRLLHLAHAWVDHGLVISCKPGWQHHAMMHYGCKDATALLLQDDASVHAQTVSLLPLVVCSEN